PEVIAPTAKIKAADGSAVKVDRPLPNAPSVAFDAVFIAGGASAAMLAKNPTAVQFVSEAFTHGKPIAGMGEASELLKAALVPADMSKGVASNDGIVTADNAAKPDAVASAFIEAMKQHRFPGRQPETINA
ncbi:MAG: DJ-1/PfpI family protein, partial [Tepidisphaeraceae bacterium]